MFRLQALLAAVLAGAVADAWIDGGVPPPDPYARPEGAAPPTGARLQLVSLEGYTNAVCSDGSPAGYYFRPGFGTGTNVWVVFLEGGLWCWDTETCQERQQTQPTRMGSESWEQYYSTPGILSDAQADSPFYSANMAYVKACTSDSWFGDTEQFGFQFRGARVVNATIESLLYDKGMASQPSARLLLGGCSSGGIGAMFNLDLVQSHLPANVELKGMLDAASWVDVTPLEQTGPTLQEMTQNMYNLLQPELGACGGVYSGTEGWKCLWPSFRLPMLRTPFFLNSFQFDTFQLSEDIWGTDDADVVLNMTAQFNFADALQSATLAMYKSLPRGTAAVFSSACKGHCLSMLPMYSTFKVGEDTMSSAMQKWYFAGRTGYRNIEECEGWGCTHRCENEWQPVNVNCYGDDCGVVTGYSTESDGLGASIGFGAIGAGGDGGLGWPFSGQGEGRR